MNAVFFNFFYSLQSIVLLFFLIYSGINTLMLILCLLNILKSTKESRYRNYKEILHSPFTTPVTIIVPCYNEEQTISPVVRSLLSLEYNEYEVIVVNDGSTDSTLELLIKDYELSLSQRDYPQSIPTQKIKNIYSSKKYTSLIVLDKENGGKADALNSGINISSCPLVISLDADSIVAKDFLQKHSFPFISEDDTLIAAGGVVKVANGCDFNKGHLVREGLPHKFIEMCQVIEYVRSFNAFRIGLSTINSILIIPGTLGIFKKDLLLEIGGYDVDTIGEDMEVILRLHKHMKKLKRKYHISILPEVECWTQVPSQLSHLKHQRIRWQRGLLDCIIKNFTMLFNPKHGVLGLFGMPYYFIFELLTPLFEMAGVFVVLISIYLNIFYLQFFLTFFTLDIVMGIFISLCALFIDNIRTQTATIRLIHLPKLIFYCVLENFGYRQLISWWRFLAFFGYKYKGNNWGAKNRKTFES